LDVICGRLLSKQTSEEVNRLENSRKILPILAHFLFTKNKFLNEQNMAFMTNKLLGVCKFRRQVPFLCTLERECEVMTKNKNFIVQGKAKKLDFFIRCK